MFLWKMSIISRVMSCNNCLKNQGHTNERYSKIDYLKRDCVIIEFLRVRYSLLSHGFYTLIHYINQTKILSQDVKKDSKCQFNWLSKSYCVEQCCTMFDQQDDVISNVNSYCYIVEWTMLQKISIYNTDFNF